MPSGIAVRDPHTGDVETLLSETTPAQLAAAGNASGEILNWIAMLGCFDARAASFVEAQRAEGTV